MSKKNERGSYRGMDDSEGFEKREQDFLKGTLIPAINEGTVVDEKTLVELISGWERDSGDEID